MKSKIVLIINAYETSMHSGHYEVIPFTNKRKAVRKARKLSGSYFLGWGATGYLTVVKNHEVVASYPIHEEIERRRGVKMKNTMSEIVQQNNAQIQEWIESVNRNEELCLDYMERCNVTSLMMAGVYYERLLQAPNKLMDLYVDVVVDQETYWALMHYVKAKTDAIVARAVAMDDEK